MTRTAHLEVIVNASIPEAPLPQRDPSQWDQAVGLARQACARIFRDGGRPSDAIRAFGVAPRDTEPGDWSKAVAMIAETLCRPAHKRAA